MKQAAVHILATVRKPELLPAATLVFSTLRTGFPEAEVMVWGNGLPGQGNGAEAVLRSCAKSVGGGFTNLSPTAHDVWIEGLVGRMYEPFWIVDTDVVFFQRTHCQPRGTMLAGRFEPEFIEEWTGTRHMARLHTAVMYIDPSAVRSAAREWMARIPQLWRNTAEFAWIRQLFVPLVRVIGDAVERVPTGRYVETLFYDTMAGVFQAVGGRAFDETEDLAFEHLHCGGYVDLIAGDKGAENFGKALQGFHERVFENPAAARGARLKQAEYYALRRPSDPLTGASRE